MVVGGCARSMRECPPTPQKPSKSNPNGEISPPRRLQGIAMWNDVLGEPEYKIKTQSVPLCPRLWAPLSPRAPRVYWVLEGPISPGTRGDAHGADSWLSDFKSIHDRFE